MDFEHKKQSSKIYGLLQDILAKKEYSPQEKLEELTALASSELSSFEYLALYIEIAFAQKGIGLLEEAEKSFLLLKNHPDIDDFPEFIAEIYGGLARTVMDQGRLEEAENLYKKAIDLYSQLKNLLRANTIKMNYGMIFYLKGDFDLALEIYQEIIAYSHKNPAFDPKNAYSMMGIIYKEKGKIINALTFFKKAAKLAKNQSDFNNYCLSQNNVAECLVELGQFKEAELIYQDGIQIAQDHHQARILSSLYISYSLMQVQLGKLHAAHHYIDRCYENMNLLNTYGKITAYTSLGQIFLMEGKFAKSIVEFEKGLKLAHTSKIEEPEIEILVNLAESYFYLEKIEKSYELLKRAEELSYRFKSKSGQIKSLILRARLNISNLNLGESELILLDAQRLAKQISSVHLHFSILLLLAEIYLIRSSNYRENKEYLQLAQSFIDQAVSLAKEKNLIIKYIQALIVQGSIYSLLDNQKASESLSTALNMAENCEISHFIEKIREKLNNLTFQQINPLEESGNVPFSINLIIEDIKRTLSPKVELNVTDVDLNQTFMLTYKVDEVMGPIIHKVLNIDEDDPKYFKQIILSGALYSSALGQGQSYHKGLFGPFPFGEGNLRSLVYSHVVFDTSQIQKRNQGSVFVLLCLIFKQQISPLFYNLSRVEEIFNSYLDKVHFINEITEDLLQQISNNIIDDLMEDYKQNQ
ncbi:tetratricopeptide repeat protein [Candidatus Lokiarchaeum ossiferum]|uniref:tetratricopeptide repeat protein n=1 Tax=Candidatus Lokiarchaeum ossiferum TaxID=2951803 RepID=UPI00352E2569